MNQQKDDSEQQRLLAIALIEKMEPQLIRILQKWTSDKYLIEDTMLDTWEDMLRNMSIVEKHPNPEGWIVKTAKYNMWKALKKRQNPP